MEEFKGYVEYIEAEENCLDSKSFYDDEENPRAPMTEMEPGNLFDDYKEDAA